MSWREVRCGRCGHRVKIPWFWVIGVEGVFYCRECRRYFRLRTVPGAIVTGIGWALSLAAVQLIAYFASAFSVALSAVAFLPGAFLFSFLLRRGAIRLLARRKGNPENPVRPGKKSPPGGTA